jgi:hypothetical protein
VERNWPYVFRWANDERKACPQDCSALQHGQLKKYIIGACQHKNDFIITEFSSVFVQMVLNLLGYRNSQKSQNSISTTRQFITYANWVCHLRSILSVAVTPLMIYRRHTEALCGITIQTCLCAQGALKPCIRGNIMDKDKAATKPNLY